MNTRWHLSYITGMVLDLEKTTLFEGKITIWQPVKGYRFALDSFMLSAFTHPQPGQHVLELGIGTGAAALALATQHPDVKIHGVEIQSQILPITQKSINENGYAKQITLFDGNLKNRIVPGHFYDHVMMNPPFFDRSHYLNSPSDHKSLSHGESDATLNDWIHEAHRTLRSRGYLTIIHTARRLDEILTILSVNFGNIEVFPLWPKAGKEAKRVLVKARKCVNGPFKLHAGLILHNSDGTLTAPAYRIIHKGDKLIL